MSKRACFPKSAHDDFAGRRCRMAAACRKGACARTRGSREQPVRGSPAGFAQLVSVEPLPGAGMDGAMCQWMPASASGSFLTAFQEEVRSGARRGGQRHGPGAGPHHRGTLTRRIARWQLTSRTMRWSCRTKISSRSWSMTGLRNTPPTATMTEPIRIIGGHETKIEFNCGLYVDPRVG